jgi:plastocyanin domain-containing protein
MSKKLIFTIIGVVLIIFIFVITSKNNGNSQASDTSVVSSQGEKQIISIKAKDGYKPSKIQAKADQSTILKLATDSTFDCSSSFTIPTLKIYKNLPQTGITEIEIPAQKSGTDLTLICSMGMYRASISFV